MTAFIAIPRDVEHRDRLLADRRLCDAEFYLIGSPGGNLDALARMVPVRVNRIITPDGLYQKASKPIDPKPEQTRQDLDAAPEVDDICAVTCFFNPLGTVSLRANYDRFTAALRAQGVPLVTVECALGDKPHSIQPIDEKLIKVRGRDAMFLKENLLNIGFKHVPSKFKKIAFLDADMLWACDTWFRKVSMLLDHYMAVQVFSDIFHLGRDGRVMHHGPSEAKRRAKHMTGWGAPGAGWAVHRSTLEACGGIFEHCVVGAGDMIHTHLGFYGDMNHSWTRQMSPEIREAAQDWAKTMHSIVRSKCTWIDTRMSHLFHGSRQKRQYTERHSLIKDAGLNWLRKNDDGVFEWSEKAPSSIKSAMRQYFLARDEDEGIELTKSTIR